MILESEKFSDLLFVGWRIRRADDVIRSEYKWSEN